MALIDGCSNFDVFMAVQSSTPLPILMSSALLFPTNSFNTPFWFVFPTVSYITMSSYGFSFPVIYTSSSPFIPLIFNFMAANDCAGICCRLVQLPVNPDELL